jgi:hypothetical protein
MTHKRKAKGFPSGPADEMRIESRLGSCKQKESTSDKMFPHSEALLCIIRKKAQPIIKS